MCRCKLDQVFTSTSAKRNLHLPFFYKVGVSWIEQRKEIRLQTQPYRVYEAERRLACFISVNLQYNGEARPPNRIQTSNPRERYNILYSTMFLPYSLLTFLYFKTCILYLINVRAKQNETKESVSDAAVTRTTVYENSKQFKMDYNERDDVRNQWPM